jgi:hypothetical protein
VARRQPRLHLHAVLLRQALRSRARRLVVVAVGQLAGVSPACVFVCLTRLLIELQRAAAAAAEAAWPVCTIVLAS